MYTKEETIYFIEQSSKIQNIFENFESFTTSDFQGAIEAVIMSTYLKGKEAKKA